ncbi:MAG: hypothetical protein ILP18_10795 [Treponema sp.]|nr:hypothetical protein [Treponema sp.]
MDMEKLMKYGKRFVLCLLVLAFFSLQLYARGMMNSRVRNVPSDISANVIQNPKKNLGALVQNLTEGLGDDGLKVRVIHDWICDNIAYDADMYFSGKVKKQDWESVLKGRKALAPGYVDLFNKMCDLAGIESIAIKGYFKGFGYGDDIPNEPNHVWNAVKIGSGWKLVDVTLDTGSLEQRTFVKRYSTQWLFLEPENFLYSHLPENSSYQYVDSSKLRTKEQFKQEPYVPGVFFEYGFRFDGEVPGYRTTVSGPVTYGFKLTDSNVSVLGGVCEKVTMVKVANASWIGRSGNSLSASFDVPTAKEYQAFVYACRSDEETYPWFFSDSEFDGNILPKAKKLASSGEISKAELKSLTDSYFKVAHNRRYYLNEDLFDEERNENVKKVFRLLKLSSKSMEEVLRFDIRSDGVYKGYGSNVVKYPTAYTEYTFCKSTSLVSPLSGTVKLGDSVHFEIATGDYSAVAVSADGGGLKKLVKGGNGNYSGDFTIGGDLGPKDEGAVPTSISVFASKDGKHYEGLWVYKVE